MITRALAAACALLLVVAAVGWGLWWARGARIARALEEREAFERALSGCRRNVAALKETLAEQDAAIEHLKAAAETTQARLEAAVRQARLHEHQAQLEAGARAQEAEVLRQRLQHLPELEACREAWRWTAEMTDDRPN